MGTMHHGTFGDCARYVTAALTKCAATRIWEQGINQISDVSLSALLTVYLLHSFQCKHHWNGDSRGAEKKTGVSQNVFVFRNHLDKYVLFIYLAKCDGKKTFYLISETGIILL